MHNACLAILATSLLIGGAPLAPNAPPLRTGASSFQKLLVGGIQSAMSLKPFCPKSAHWRS